MKGDFRNEKPRNLRLSIRPSDVTWQIRMGSMGVVLLITGLVGIALLVYLFYVLFWGENL